MSPAPDCDWTAGLVIVGAGAAGLWAAGVAAARGADVLLLEKTPRTGTKILASGGTRCNLTTTLGPLEAAKLFGRRGERFLRAAFDALPPADLRARFEGLGVPTVEAPLEKIFPASQSARDVRDALEREARERGVRIVLDAEVERVEPLETGPSDRSDARWSVVLRDGRRAAGRDLFLCSGGESYARTGTTGDGYAWLASLDLPLVRRAPALVPLTSSAEWVRELTGIAWADGEARLCDGAGKVLGRRRRPLLFTHQGLSGPAAMDLSRWVTTAEPDESATTQPPAGAPSAPEFTLLLDLFPDLSRDELRARLIAAAERPGSPRLSRALPVPVPRRLLAAVGSRAGVEGSDPRLAGLGKSQRHALVETLKGLAIPVSGSLGYDKAEVTAGGLSLRAVNPRTMEVNGRGGLYVFGELLDLDGPIGGLNFQAAFACAELAALDATRDRGGE